MIYSHYPDQSSHHPDQISHQLNQISNQLNQISHQLNQLTSRWRCLIPWATTHNFLWAIDPSPWATQVTHRGP